MDGADDEPGAAPDAEPQSQRQPTVDEPAVQPPLAGGATPQQAVDGDSDVADPAARRDGEDDDDWEYADPPPVQTGDETPPTA